MMYPFITLEDNTEITHSEKLSNGEVKVYIETPDVKDGFHNLTCYIPSYSVTDVSGYSPEEVDSWISLIKNNSHLIMEYSEKGGLVNAAGL